MTLLVLNEEQTMLRESAQGFLQEKAPVQQLRELRDSRDETGFSTALWQEMADMGFIATLIPEAYGGAEFGHVGMGQIIQQSGRTLSASPLFSTGVLGVSALVLAGSDEQKQALLPAIAEGKLLTALAVDEARRHAPTRVKTRAEKSGDGFTVNGEKVYVVDGHVADKLIVSVRTSGEENDRDGITLLLIDRTAPGVEVERVIAVDSRNYAVVRFKDVKVGTDAVLGAVDGGAEPLEQVLDIGNAHLAAELLGISEEVFERTLQYLKERKQFGVIIGTFQALQHRAADLWSEIEVLKSCVLRALKALDENSDRRASLVSLAKVKAAQTSQLATNEGVQLHGGIGMTDEFDIGFFLKRARPVAQLFGDDHYHTDRYARLRGY